MMTKPEILTLSQAAEFLQVSERTILRMLKDGRIPGRQVGSQWRFDREQLRDWVRGEEPPAERELTQLELIEKERARLGVDLPEAFIDLQQAARKRLGEQHDD